MKNIVSIAYRRDIDGLRALAVLSVVAFHAAPHLVPGGFAGVDIFFVISGFLIGGIVGSEIQAGVFSIAMFYARRARRILPALAAVVGATTIASFAILFPEDLKEYGRSLLALSVFASNLYFARKTGYFDSAADEKPLLHTWSLAIEEQFYLVFPALMFLLLRYRPAAAVPVIGIIASVSLAFSVFLTANVPERAFFSTGARVWELALGVLCAIAILPPLSARWREFAGALGALLVACAIFWLSEETPYPGVAAIVPTAGAALLITAGRGGETVVGRILSHPWLVGVGLISYSVYLWHWPLLVFAKYRFGAEAGPGLVAALVAASLALGYLSWRFVERPFRHPRGGTDIRALAAGFAVLATCAVAAEAIVFSGGMPSRWPQQVASMLKPSANPYRCVQLPASSGWPAGACAFGDYSRAELLVWGDSHAKMMSHGIFEALDRSGGSAILVSTGGCPPLSNVLLYGRSKKGSCLRSAKEVLEKLAEGHIHRVVLAARWAYYAEGSRAPGEGGQPARLSEDPTGNAATFVRLLQDTVRVLEQRVGETTIIASTPEFNFSVTLTMARSLVWGRKLPTENSRHAFEVRQLNVLPVLASLAREHSVSVFYPDRWLCGAETCPYASNGQPLYADTNHLNRAGVSRLKPMFEAMLSEPPRAGVH